MRRGRLRLKHIYPFIAILKRL